MLGPPQVSLIMPVRDGERWLHEAIDSVLAQTLSNFELIVIDDGSADASPAILDAYRARDVRITVLRQEREGLVAALNRGLAQARAPLIARLDADDIAPHGRLSRQCEYLAAHADVVLVGGWAVTIDEQGVPSGRKMRPRGERLDDLLLKKNPFIHSTVMYRTEVGRQIGGYRAAFEAAEDYDFCLRLSEIGKLAILPEVMASYRVHGASVTRTRALRQLYSDRLARSAASARRTGGADPAAGLIAPPDWHAPGRSDAERDGFRLYRMLEFADPALARAADPASIDLAAITAQRATLSSGERKFARAALLNLLRERPGLPGASRASLMTLLLRLGPAKAISALLASCADRAR